MPSTSRLEWEPTDSWTAFESQFASGVWVERLGTIFVCACDNDCGAVPGIYFLFVTYSTL